jgi:predicted protein tyrosine phosphatase
MRIQSCARYLAERAEGAPTWAVISLRAQGEDPADLKPGWGAVTFVELNDDDQPDPLAIRAIAHALFRAWEDGREGVLVHCAMGVSRSVAVARAAAAVLGWEYAFQPPHYGNWAVKQALHSVLAWMLRARSERPFGDAV